MEAHSHFGRIGTGRSGGVFASRRGSVIVALLSAVLAGVLIYMFVSRYHKTTVALPATGTVYVARKYIPAGTPETAIIAGDMLKPEVLPLSQMVAGAVADPSVIEGTVAAEPIAAGQQASTSDFSHANVTIASYLSGDERAIALAIDPAHGLTSYLTRGDTVDMITSGPGGSSLTYQDITVLGNQGGDVVLEMTDKQALVVSEAQALNLTFRFVLRPVTGAKSSVPQGYTVKS